MKPRLFFTPLAALLSAFILWLAITGIGQADDPPVPQTVPETVQGKTAAQWQHVASRYLNRTRTLAHAIHFDPEVSTAINLACTVYGHCSELWRKARCETGGSLSRYSANRTSSARGLFQFLTTPNGGTWGSTPYGRFSVYDPYANALAAGWMHSRGRGGEWVCQ